MFISSSTSVYPSTFLCLHINMWYLYRSLFDARRTALTATICVLNSQKLTVEYCSREKVHGLLGLRPLPLHATRTLRYDPPLRFTPQTTNEGFKSPSKHLRRSSSPPLRPPSFNPQTTSLRVLFPSPLFPSCAPGSYQSYSSSLTSGLFPRPPLDHACEHPIH